MLTTRPSKEREIYNELSNFFMHLSLKQEIATEVYRSRLPKLIDIWTSSKQEKYLDPCFIASKREQCVVWVRKLQNLELLRLLSLEVEEADFCGLRLSLVQIAEKLIIQKRLNWEGFFDEWGIPEFARSCLRVTRCDWGKLFEELGEDPNKRVKFPERGEFAEIVTLGEKLCDKVEEGTEITVAEFAEFIGLDSKSKKYKELRKYLEQEGWKWLRAKRDGKVVRVIQRLPKG